MPDVGRQTVFIECAGETIPVSLSFRERKRLSISVHPDGSVTAIAPLERSHDDVLAHLRHRRSWITKQRRHFEKFQPLPDEKRFVSGETHLYLGRQYRLRVRPSDDHAVKLLGRYFNVYVSDPTESRMVSNALDIWYRTHAEAILQERVQMCLESTATFRGSNIQLRVRRMKRRWGSCSNAGTITLNIDLIKTPMYCIEYVIMHELCHLCVPNHSPAFFRLLGRCMPDWEMRKTRLDSFVIH